MPFVTWSSSSSGLPGCSNRILAFRSMIQGRVDTDQTVVVAGGRVPTDEARDALFGGAVEHLADRVEVLLADSQHELAQGATSG